MTSTTSSASTATTSAGTDDIYTWTIRETTVRNWAIGIGITLGVLLICALITIQVMRSKMKRLKKEREVYAQKLSTAMGWQNVKYESMSPNALESGLVIPRHELESEREVYESDATPINTIR